MMALILTGDDANLPQELTDAEVNHLRRLLAWLRCEYTLDEDMQRGYLQGAAQCVAHGHSTPEQAGTMVQAKADEIAAVPAYIRQAVKMLTKAVRDHDAKTRVIHQEPRP